MAIENYTPVDTDDTLYLLENTTLSVMLDAIKEKWGDVDFDNIRVDPQYIHTRCLGYDLYDASDFDNYLVITLT